MADNYLERKMDDYRSGRVSKTTKHRNAPAAYLPLEGKKALVTGGASPIGRAIVNEFIRQGAKTAFCDIDLENGNRFAQLSGARFYHTDLSSPEQIIKMMENLFKVWGDVDIIVNNAAKTIFQPLTELDIDEWNCVMDTNVRSIFLIARTWAKHRADTNRFGRIINIASTRAMMSEPLTESYSASKGAIVALTHALMASLSPLGITVNAISPGWIHTNPKEIISEQDNLFHPSGRVGIPDDVAALTAFLASEKAQFINGQNIVIDGGVTRKMIYP